MKITQTKVLISGFVMAIALLCGIAFIEFSYNNELRNTTADVARTQAGENELQQLLTLMIDVETGVRGYVISGVPAYLEPFTLAVEKLESQRKLVRSLILAEDRQAALTELDQLLLRRVELARGVIQIRNEHGLDVARIKRQMDIGKETMDKIRALVRTIEIEQESLIKTRIARSIAESETAQRIMLGGAVLSVGLMTLVMFLLLRENKLRRESEQTLAVATREAKHANATKDVFLANMSHEIRTPLNGLLGMLELLAISPLNREQSETLEIARDSGRAMGRIIDDILDHAKISAGKLDISPEPTNIAEVLSRLINTYQASASAKNIVLRSMIDPRISQALMVDALRLLQIMGNFASNALKFTEAGYVEIRADLIKREDDKDAIRFTVKDTGIGMTADQQKRLFLPFEQATSDTTRLYGGTGLGLAISRQLVEMMGGTIRCESVVGQGTSMIIALILPIANAQTSPLMTGWLTNERQHLEQLRANQKMVQEANENAPLVLAVDDHPTNRLLLSRQLGILGLRVEKAANGREALALWQSGAYALVISDCNMPEMDGYALTRAIRDIETSSDRARTPVLAWTANALESSVKMCLEAGMDDVLFKPAELIRLKVLVEKWLPDFKVDGASVLGGVSALASTAAGAPAPVPAPEVARAPLAASEQKPTIDRILLTEICAPDVDFARQFAGSARDSIAALTDELLAAVDSENIREINRVGHRLRGLAANVAATTLAQVCADFEDFNAAQHALLPSMRTQLIAEVARARPELAQIAAEK